MKLTSLILLLGCLHAAARSTAQTVTLNVKDQPIEKVFSEIRRQTGYTFTYTQEVVDGIKTISLNLKDATIDETMVQCLKGFPYSYRIINKTISIDITAKKYGAGLEDKNKVPLTDVHGRVTNEKGDPVEGVTVTIKGTHNATSTDANGNFMLHTVNKNIVLIFTSVNTETLELKVDDSDEIIVKLKPKVAALEDVAINFNTGYQVVSKERATGSFTFINKQQLDQRVAPDILTKLEGITNGLAFNKDANTGANILRVRGESTLFANPTPLIIVDNFPYDGDINNINPNDVENITILKDAAAASIWGVQAGNGVIVITTRKGKYSQPMKFELNSNVTISEKPDLFYYPQIKPSDYIELEQYLFSQHFYDASLSDPTMPVVSPVIEILNSQRSGVLSAAEAANQINILKTQDSRNDLNKYFYQRAINQQYQVNVSGGTDKYKYYFSAGHDRNRSAAIGDNDTRSIINYQNTYNPISKLEIKAGLIYTETTELNNSLTRINNLYPYMTIYDSNGNMSAIPQHRAKFEDTISNHGFNNWKYFPLIERSLLDNKSKTNDTRIITSLKYNLIDGLNIDISYQFERSATQANSYSSPKSYYIRNLLNTYAILDANKNYTGSYYPNGGQKNIASSSLIGHYGRGSINYFKTFGDHNIAAIAGAEVRQVETENSVYTLYGYNIETGASVIPDNLTYRTQYPSGASSLMVDPNLNQSSGATTNRFRSFFGNIAYTYKERYTLSYSARVDGSNYFGVSTNKKNVPLWSTGIKWQVDRESFYNISFLEKLALRATYGFNGNLSQNLAAITTFRYKGNDAITGMPWSVIDNVPNPDLRWEKTAHFNFGADFSALGNRLSGSLEYFQKRGRDLIGDAFLDPTLGITQLRGNFSSMKSQGIDIQINSKNIDNKFKWTSAFIFNYTSETITRYDVPASTPSYLLAYKIISPVVGRPLYSLYSYKWGGLDPANGNPRGYLADTLTSNYADLSNKSTLNDLRYNGRYNPPVTGAILNNFYWRNIGLTFNITYKFGYYFRRSSINYYSLINSGWSAGNSDYALRWQKPGDELSTVVPSLIYPPNSQRDNFYSLSEALIEKGDHIRLQFINLSYGLNKKLIEKLPFQALQIYIYCNNIGILWRENKRGIDPDYPYINYPTPRTYALGIKANF